MTFEQVTTHSGFLREIANVTFDFYNFGCLKLWLQNCRFYLEIHSMDLNENLVFERGLNYPPHSTYLFCPAGILKRMLT